MPQNGQPGGQQTGQAPGLPSLQDIIRMLGEGKPGGGQGGQPGFGQAGGQPQETDPPADPQAGPQADPQADPNFDNDPLGQYSRQQGIAQIMAGAAGHGNMGMGPNTSEALQLHGNELRAAAEAQQRYLDELRMNVELGKLGINVPGQPSGVQRAIEEDEAAKKAKEKTKESDGSNKPGGYGMADPGPRF